MSEKPLVYGRYNGDEGVLFWLALRTGFLALITLGIYRFWGKTRIRSYIWSHATVEGAAFEYTGTGLEKLLGFLVAMVILAVYLSLVQLALFSLGMRYVMRPVTQQQVLAQMGMIYSTLFALAPLYFFASYRARRYKLARTRWRGIRFGMDKAALGYTWRACLYLLATILTLGLLHPLMWFRLESYKTKRTWYGDAQMAQNGHWTGLYRSMKHIFIALGVLMLTGVVASTSHAFGGLAILGAVAGYIWMMVGVMSYWVQGTAWLTRNKVLLLTDGGQVALAMALRTSTMLGYYVGGSLGIGVLVFLIGLVTKPLSAILKAALANAPPVLVLGAGAFTYMAFLTLLSALTLAFIRQRILGYMISQTVVAGADALGAVRQRGAEAGADADGFAEALDLGGAF